MYTYLIKNAHIIDPKSKTSEIKDLAIIKNTIAKIAPNITGDAEHIIDAKGLYLTPGLRSEERRVGKEC